MLLACAGTAETMAPTVHMGKASTCCKFIPVCDKSFLTTKEYAICRPPHQKKHIHFLWIVGRALNAISDRNKTNLFCKF